MHRNSELVHRLLAHLEDVGFDGAPRFLEERQRSAGARIFSDMLAWMVEAGAVLKATVESLEGTTSGR